MAATSRCVLTALAELHNKRYVYSSHTVLSLLQYLTLACEDVARSSLSYFFKKTFKHWVLRCACESR